MTGTVLANSLASGDVTIVSTNSVVTGAGNINVFDAISWSANKLTLNAQKNININANLNASGTASLALLYGQDAASGTANLGNIVTNNASVDLPAGTNNFTTKFGSDGVVETYTIITSLGAEGSTTGTDLQGMNNATAGTNFALGSDIDAAATLGWNSGLGFDPITGFAGTSSTDLTFFDGLGHTISNLTINRPLQDSVGLFGMTSPWNVIRNVGLLDAGVRGRGFTGGLVGYSIVGLISNSYVTGNVFGKDRVGGLTGSNDGSNKGYAEVFNSYSTATVTATGNWVGGLVGFNVSRGLIKNSYATGNVNGNIYVGGLSGLLNTAYIENSYATGDVTGLNDVGGLLGANDQPGIVSNSYASGSVTSTGTGDVLWFFRPGAECCDPSPPGYVGGLLGYNTGKVNTSYSTGLVSGETGKMGGLIGFNAPTRGGVVNNSFWDTTASGQVTSLDGTAMGTVDMKVQANFTSATAANGSVDPGWDFTNTWAVDAITNNGYPTFKWQAQIVPPAAPVTPVTPAAPAAPAAPVTPVTPVTTTVPAVTVTSTSTPALTDALDAKDALVASFVRTVYQTQSSGINTGQKQSAASGQDASSKEQLTVASDQNASTNLQLTTYRLINGGIKLPIDVLASLKARDANSQEK
jgi:hypothetical protein